MASIVLPGSGLWMPPPVILHRVAVPAFNNFGLIDSGTDQLAYIFRAPKTGTLEWFELHFNIMSTFPATGIRLSWQDVDLATGFPDGVIDQFVVIASNPGAAWATPPNALTDDGTAGGVKRSVTRGDLVAAVIDINPVFSTGSFQPSQVTTTETTGPQLFPYAAHFTGSWAKIASMYPLFAVKYADGLYEPLGVHIWPMSSAGTSLSYNSGSTPDEVGLRFKVPFEGVLAGGWLSIAAVGNFDLVLYDDADAVVASVSVDVDTLQTTTNSKLIFEFPTPATISSGRVYRLMLKPTTGSNVTIFWAQALDNDRLRAMPGGKEFYESERTDGGTWSDDNDRWPLMGLQFSEIAGGNVPIVITASDGLR